MKIGITSDCSSGLEYAPFEHKIKITRTTIHFGDEELIDGIDISADEFYQRLEVSDVVPSTSAPTPGELIARAEEWKNEGCTDVIHFPISFGLSAYGENLQAVAYDYIDGLNYHVFNCHSACIMEGYCAHYAEILANKGYSVDAIFAECKKMSDQTVAYFVVDDLKYLIKNGRLSVASGLVGSLIRIKPILKLGLSGKIETYEKIRTHTKAIERTIEIVKEETKNAKQVIYLIQHSNRLDEAIQLKKRLEKEYLNGIRFDISTVPPTVGAHIGSGLLSVGYIILDGLKETI